MGGFNLQDMISQARKQYDVLQKKMQETVVEASAGGGSVNVKMDGRKNLLSVKIDPGPGYSSGQRGSPENR
jgi:nucleoid-associated protein EbfC